MVTRKNSCKISCKCSMCFILRLPVGDMFHCEDIQLQQCHTNYLSDAAIVCHHLQFKLLSDVTVSVIGLLLLQHLTLGDVSVNSLTVA